MEHEPRECASCGNTVKYSRSIRGALYYHQDGPTKGSWLCPNGNDANTFAMEHKPINKERGE